ncbi:dihydrofolate reductase family protein [Pseudodesulfovibrio sp. zrk46]|uniref:dihydrofolate reductase family protein n=1 Tax=Pseudodesulfovibrio sp. zrk46 TaxID=2725288 RepID=UPI0014495110|nr:dihydrofolate reductase family protein [Pseudodesulfovibrio sp. zrk46]QJB56062.1 dihydrofolate reductase [Pseudodesulfovibrio sp. zrk46]
MPNIVYVGASLDGYIADRNGGLEWLGMVPNPDNSDYGFAEFMDSIDALLMGRKTLETVLEFGCEWPYSKSVFVLSGTMTEVPDAVKDKVEIVNDTLENVVSALNTKGFERLYVDGGQLVQGCLNADLIDELIITRIPILLGGGTPLFGALPSHLEFDHIETTVLLGEMVKSHYKRKR